MIWDGLDQRKFPRVSYKCLIRVAKDAKEDAIHAHTENVGSGGICVSLKKKYSLFEEVHLEIFLTEDQKPITCKGTICWIVKRHPTAKTEKLRYDTGIEFKDILEEDRRRIAQLVQGLL